MSIQIIDAFSTQLTRMNDTDYFPRLLAGGKNCFVLVPCNFLFCTKHVDVTCR